MVLGKLPVQERLPNLIISGQEPFAVVVHAGWVCLDIFSHLSFLFSFSLSQVDGPM